MTNEKTLIKLTDHDPTYAKGAGFRIVLTNKTENKLTVTAEAHVNNFALHPIWAQEQRADEGYLLNKFYLTVERGETIETYLYFPKESLAELDINKIDTVSFPFVLTEYESGEGGDVLSKRDFDCEAITSDVPDMLEGARVLAENENFSVKAGSYLQASDCVTVYYTKQENTHGLRVRCFILSRSPSARKFSFFRMCKNKLKEVHYESIY